MNFSEALALMKQGKRVKRPSMHGGCLLLEDGEIYVGDGDDPLYREGASPLDMAEWMRHNDWEEVKV